ncbi:hypothetical protein D3C80_1942870 [compost metagenome]
MTRNFRDEIDAGYLSIADHRSVEIESCEGETMRAVSRWSLAILALALSVPTLANAQDQECGNVDAIIRQAYPGTDAQSE